jgi:hypothetical protein
MECSILLEPVEWDSVKRVHGGMANTGQRRQCRMRIGTPSWDCDIYTGRSFDLELELAYNLDFIITVGGVKHVIPGVHTFEWWYSGNITFDEIYIGIWTYGHRQTLRVSVCD